MRRIDEKISNQLKANELLCSEIQDEIVRLMKENDLVQIQISEDDDTYLSNDYDLDVVAKYMGETDAVRVCSVKRNGDELSIFALKDGTEYPYYDLEVSLLTWASILDAVRDNI